MIRNLTDSEQQSLVYSLILLTVLLGSVVLRRDFKFSQALKYFAIWGVVAFVGIVLYSYRFEFSSFKNRILGEVNPASARLDGEGRLVVNISQDGHFYLDTKINNQSVRFMIDTGASDIVLNINDAKKVGIDSQNLVFDKRYHTANGVVLGASIRLKEIEIAGVKFYDVRASVNSADLGVSLLGMEFLRQFRRYEFYQDKLMLEL
ncbi:MAG TPA: TIGR02281 family clan AA aspartic protease [Rickettsiales bacterium]|nr:TIGR02281 family clan AA aspartic protease [Rickettsiales bacterium]